MQSPKDKPKEKLDFGAPEQVRKARMLVSMLGADFAKGRDHPFFRDLAKTAIQPVPDKKLSKPEMSRALEKLVKHLAEPRRAPPQRPRPAAQPKLPEPPQDDVFKQHPVLIAKHLATLSANERLSVMRSLPGRTARMVAAYSAELSKEK